MDNPVVINVALNVLRPDVRHNASKEVTELAEKVLGLHFKAEALRLETELELLISKNKKKDE